MLTASAISALISEYVKHGWVLRRVLLSDFPNEGEMSALFADAEVITSDIDALWFSRRSRPDRETWELRRLKGTPYAVDSFLENTMDAETREEILAAAEDRIRESMIIFSDN
jgi:hypothetical protein